MYVEPIFIEYIYADVEFISRIRMKKSKMIRRKEKKKARKGNFDAWLTRAGGDEWSFQN